MKKYYGKFRLTLATLVAIYALIVLCGNFVYVIIILQTSFFTLRTSIIKFPHFEDQPVKEYLIKTEGCSIPDMDPYDPAIAKYIFDDPPLICNNGTPPLIDSNETSIYLLQSSLTPHGIHNISALFCCYNVLYLVSDKLMSVSSNCTEFNNSRVITDEFIKVTCWYQDKIIYKDFFSFVQLRLNYTRRSSQANVLIIGLDGMSRLNLHRQMPMTVKVLQEMEALEFMAYNKVADNTFPNLIPLLTGLTEETLFKECWLSNGVKFDSCPLIWKSFASRGFITALGEDSASTGIFSHLRRGFLKKPTNYYWTPFDYTIEQKIGNVIGHHVYKCAGSRPIYKVILSYIKKFILAMHRKGIPYFGFFWTSTLTHDRLNAPKHADIDFVNFFRQLDEEKVFKNTILIFLSGHGIRWGGIRSTLQGRMEERLPFLFIKLPEKYRKKYTFAYYNLLKNRRKLTTPFDVHRTLEDLQNPGALTDWKLLFRTPRKGKSYSLFEHIPATRTCSDAGISPHWCTCHLRKELIELNLTSFIVNQLAEFAVAEINKMIQQYSIICEQLHLVEIKRALLNQSIKKNVNDYTVVIRTMPGSAVFEATVRQHVNNSDSLINDRIIRVTLYKNQSHCFSNATMQLYCFCKTFGE